jgi:hypothetical protein
MAMAMALAGVGDAMLANWVLSLRFSVEVEVLWELEEHGSWKLEVISVFFEYSFFSLMFLFSLLISSPDPLWIPEPS